MSEKDLSKFPIASDESSTLQILERLINLDPDDEPKRLINEFTNHDLRVATIYVFDRSVDEESTEDDIKLYRNACQLAGAVEYESQDLVKLFEALTTIRGRRSVHSLSRAIINVEIPDTDRAMVQNALENYLGDRLSSLTRMPTYQHIRTLYLYQEVSEKLRSDDSVVEAVTNELIDRNDIDYTTLSEKEFNTYYTHLTECLNAYDIAPKATDSAMENLLDILDTSRYPYYRNTYMQIAARVVANALAIPEFGRADELVTLATLQPDGAKEYLKLYNRSISLQSLNWCQELYKEILTNGTLDDEEIEALNLTTSRHLTDIPRVALAPDEEGINIYKQENTFASNGVIAYRGIPSSELIQNPLFKKLETELGEINTVYYYEMHFLPFDQRKYVGEQHALQGLAMGFWGIRSLCEYLKERNINPNTILQGTTNPRMASKVMRLGFKAVGYENAKELKAAFNNTDEVVTVYATAQQLFDRVDSDGFKALETRTINSMKKQNAY